MLQAGQPGSNQQRADLELVRVGVAPEGAFGVLVADGVPIGPVTLERTYAVAESEPRGPQFVKIPTGVYLCKRTRFVRGNHETYEVTGVVGHSRLLLHRGNAESDSDGCVLVGQRFGRTLGYPGVLTSALGFEEFMSWAGGRPEFWLSVRSV